MKSVVFLSCIVLLVRASPPNDGLPLSDQLPPPNLGGFYLLHALTIRTLQDYQYDTFNYSLIPGAENALDEILSLPSRDPVTPSNNMNHVSGNFEHGRDSMDFDIMEKSYNELQTARKYFWNDAETYEREVDNTFVSIMNEPADDSDVHSHHYLGSRPSSYQNEEKTKENDEQDANMQEKGIASFYQDCSNFS